MKIEKNVHPKQTVQSKLDKTAGEQKRIAQYSKRICACPRSTYFSNMDIDDYIFNFSDSDTKHHKNGDKKNA